MELKPLKVSEVNRYIKRVLTSDPILHNIRVEGEISNFKHHYSGHMYFSLKDNDSKLNCIMFNNSCKNLSFTPEDGMSVVAIGYISVYERNGNYQLYVTEMTTKGIGDLFIEFEKLKKKLEEEGLFDENKKKPIPKFPKKIGVVTSSKGAAVKDIVTVVKRRLPSAEIIIYPVLVQGPRASEDICKGLEHFNSRNDIDVVITGRGGGSIEELWAFNEENVARTIHKMKIPVVSAVGHETDFTIADFVSDLRAPTPSAAGELSVPSKSEVNSKLNELFNRLYNSYSENLNKNRSKIALLKVKLEYNNPIDKINQKKQTLDILFKELIKNNNYLLEKYKNKVEMLEEKLYTLSPVSIIERGYTLTLNKDGHVIKSINELKKNEVVNIKFIDGTAKMKVVSLDLEKEEENNLNERKEC
ncbi:exodeoxyribonuclease VII large subunit [Caldisalinibacter kiritimatiensis]|uniref:Exodeoxyribonuclease 7 large subunit n=1 Tax=Caldisalinibacter kiritimatiensis TaxID=1304284 RepID=R1AYF6_9FIRM|nr:exodeoxyribonuclease VII large subunit [Caldisalinibacter kiritimatiensis]EOD01727.1 Exodeoxyribonuclease VII large subunit [Caldisalinibacter kiritimatiensis]